MVGLQCDKQHMGRRYIDVFQVCVRESPRYMTKPTLNWLVWPDLDTSLQAKRSDYYNTIASQVQAGTEGGDPRMMGYQSGPMQMGMQSNYSTGQGQQMGMDSGMLNSGMCVVF